MGLVKDRKDAAAYTGGIRDMTAEHDIIRTDPRTGIEYLVAAAGTRIPVHKAVSLGLQGPGGTPIDYDPETGAFPNGMRYHFRKPVPAPTFPETGTSGATNLANVSLSGAPQQAPETAEEKKARLASEAKAAKADVKGAGTPEEKAAAQAELDRIQSEAEKADKEAKEASAKKQEDLKSARAELKAATTPEAKAAAQAKIDTLNGESK